MPTTTTTLTADGSVLIAYLRKARVHTQYLGTEYAYGTFGGGTLSFYLSPDGGTTKIPLTLTPGGTGVALTSDGTVVYTLGTPSTNSTQITLWATLAGSSGASITILHCDNNN